MSVWALVPAKDFGRGKSRLRPALSDDARAAFARSLFDHVLGALTASQVVDRVLVATDSPVVAAAARSYHAAVRLDPPGPATLAAVVDGGLAELAARGARGALVLMADLPHLASDDVRSLVALLDDHEVAIVRADDGQHTNALALAPPTCLATAFGRPDSFAAHVAAARAAGLRVAIADSARVAFDVDSPDELARLVAAPTPS
jgi:2-phospho-L-lactate/phosphoenolpyruvate guanylyltransferase